MMRLFEMNFDLRKPLATVLALGAMSIVTLSIPTRASEKSEKTPLLPNGLYLVLRSSRDSKTLEPIREDEMAVAQDFHLLEPEEREPTMNHVLQVKPFIPFDLDAPPKEDTEEGTNKPRLQLKLTESQIKPLETFTRQHLGETVAIVIGDEIVTTHKIKSAIEGGRLQIVRCTKHGCETLFTRLLRDTSKN